MSRMARLVVMLALLALSSASELRGKQQGVLDPTVDDFDDENFDANDIAITKEFIEEVNAAQGSWTAGSNKKFEGMTIQEIRDMMTYSGDEDFSKLKTRAPRNKNIAKPLPKNFDARTYWPRHCHHPIRDQGRCGSCWAFGIATTLDDRFCIKSDGKVDVMLSTQCMVSCDTNEGACKSGNIVHAMEWVSEVGIWPDQCFPYVSGFNMTVPQCPAKCIGPKTDGATPRNYFYQKDSLIWLPTEESIQQEIYENGPVIATFRVMMDLIVYKRGVYNYTSGAQIGGHAVRMFGWGEDEDTGLPYWWIANSWGDWWGDHGYFKMLRGSNVLDIESGIFSGAPDLKRSGHPMPYPDADLTNPLDLAIIA